MCECQLRLVDVLVSPRYSVIIEHYDPRKKHHLLNFLGLKGVKDYYDINNPRRRLRWVTHSGMREEQLDPKR